MAEIYWAGVLIGGIFNIFKQYMQKCYFMYGWNVHRVFSLFHGRDTLYILKWNSFPPLNSPAGLLSLARSPYF